MLVAVGAGLAFGGNLVAWVWLQVGTVKVGIRPQLLGVDAAPVTLITVGLAVLVLACRFDGWGWPSTTAAAVGGGVLAGWAGWRAHQLASVLHDGPLKSGWGLGLPCVAVGGALIVGGALATIRLHKPPSGHTAPTGDGWRDPLDRSVTL
jgi:hypothetical protein